MIVIFFILGFVIFFWMQSSGFFEKLWSIIIGVALGLFIGLFFWALINPLIPRYTDYKDKEVINIQDYYTSDEYIYFTKDNGEVDKIKADGCYIHYNSEDNYIDSFSVKAKSAFWRFMMTNLDTERHIYITNNSLREGEL